MLESRIAAIPENWVRYEIGLICSGYLGARLGQCKSLARTAIARAGAEDEKKATVPGHGRHEVENSIALLHRALRVARLSYDTGHLMNCTDSTKLVADMQHLQEFHA
jgi:hypothetical protein